MLSPVQISIQVPGTNYKVIVDTAKSSCVGEEPHCHVNNAHGEKINLSTFTFVTIPNGINMEDRRRILNMVSMNRYPLRNAYEHNRTYGDA